MRATRLTSVLLVALALAACGNKEAERGVAASNTPSSTATSQPQVQQKAAANPDKATKIAGLNEDGTETVGDSAGDSGARPWRRAPACAGSTRTRTCCRCR